MYLQIIAAFSICLTAIAAAAVTGPVRAPVLGFIQLSPGELRPITGFVGANIVEGPISFGAEVSRVSPAPGQNYALVELGERNQIAVARVDGTGVGSLNPISGALNQLDRVIYSPSGRSVVLYSSRLKRLQAITGLPEAPRIAREVETAAFRAAPAAMAVSDDAEVILAAFSSSGDTAFVARIESDAPPATVLNAASISAIRFMPQAHTAVIADAGANQVLLLSEDSASPGKLSVRVLAGEAEGVSAPRDIETSLNGGLVFVANSMAANVLTIESASGKTRILPCGFAPFSFQRLIHSAVGVVGRDGESISVFDSDAAAPWLAFAPRAR